MHKTILLCGVGGQGTILAAHILAKAALDSGMDVKVSEIHGMSQRGGAVTTVVTYGDEVHSMVCDKGGADCVVSFEMLEAKRNLDQLKLGAPLIVNDEIIKPASVLTAKATIPTDLREQLIDVGAMLVPAHATAVEAGSSKAANIVLLGALSHMLDFEESAWESAIREHVPSGTEDTNLLAFKAGRAFAAEHSAN